MIEPRPTTTRLYRIVLTASVPVCMLAAIACSESTSVDAVSTVTTVTVSAGNLQVAPVGTPLTDSLVVLVTNSSGVGVANVPVHWTPNSAGGSPSTSSGTTNANGMAKIAWTLGTIAGLDSMTATANGLSAVFIATATVGAPARVTPVNYTSVIADSGSTLPPLTAQVTDLYGNAIPNVPVTWAVTAGGGSLTSTTATTNSTGLATTTWTLGRVGGGTVNTVTATVQSVTGTIPPATFTAMAGYPPPQLIAQAGMATIPEGFAWPILYVGIQGQSIPLELSLASGENAMTPSLLSTLSSSGGSVTTQMGTVTRTLVFASLAGDYANGYALGLLGAPTLSQFDWMDNGPKDSISMYAQPSHPTSQPVWLPAGVTVADCVPLQSDPYGRVFFSAQVNGIAMQHMFDFGFRRSNMNLAALTALGFDTLSPNVHSLSNLSYTNIIGSDTARWGVTGLRVTIGARTVAIDSAIVYRKLSLSSTPTTPILALGTAAFIDRTVFLSYSSQHFCVGQP